MAGINYTVGFRTRYMSWYTGRYASLCMVKHTCLCCVYYHMFSGAQMGSKKIQEVQESGKVKDHCRYQGYLQSHL